MRRITKLIDSDSETIVFDEFVGKYCSEILKELSVDVNSSSKNFLRVFVDRFIHSPMVNFDDSGYVIKTVRMVCPLKVKESMSLRVADYCSMVEQDWEESDFKKELSQKYIFFIFEGSTSIDTMIFRGVVPFMFSEEDLNEAKSVWLDTVSKIRKNIYNQFITEKESGSFFFKIHAATTSDVILTPGGGENVKRSFWIAKKFINNRILSQL